MNIIISKLSRKTQGDGLKKAFLVHGKVSFVQIVIEKATGKPNGVAIVEMKDENEANSAIVSLNNTRMDGSIIQVKQARPYIS